MIDSDFETTDADFEVLEECLVCEGGGTLDGKTCPRCGGDGLVPHIHMAIDPDGEAVEIEIAV